METRWQAANRSQRASQENKELRERDTLQKTATWLIYITAAWALLYALYRGYYALGGTVGMFGTPVSENTWRLVNAVGAALILCAAMLPVATARLWRHSHARLMLLAIGWVIAVGCVMHGLIDIITRVLSLAGLLPIELPFFVASSVDLRASNLQDIFLNEPWFLGEGLLWGALCLVELSTTQARRWWLASALAAIAALTVIGVLSSLGVIGRFIIG